MGTAPSPPGGMGVPVGRGIEVNTPRPALGIVEGARYSVHSGGGGGGCLLMLLLIV